MGATKVLIVDDELPIREQLRMFSWPSYNYTLVGEARHGADALKLYGEKQPDIVLTDIAMPVMDGLELTKRLRALNPELQIILLTCHRDFEYARQALLLGVNDYLLKGTYRQEDLLHALEQARSRLKPVSTGKELRYEIEEAITYVQKHIREPLSLADVAEKIQLSPNYFGNLFRQETGQYFKDYIKQIRLEKAASLLKGSSLKIYEIAEQTGFANYRYFSEVFTEEYGVTPREYRSSHDS